MIVFYQIESLTPNPSPRGERLKPSPVNKIGGSKIEKASLAGGFDPVLIENYKKINVRGAIAHGHAVQPGYHLRQ